MYPELFRIGNFSISTFGVMMALAFLIGTWITARRMREEGLDPELVTSLLLYVMIGGIVGSKLYFAVDVSLREGRPFTELLFARAAASGPPVEPLTTRPKRSCRPSRAPGTERIGARPAERKRMGSDRGPNHPRKTSTSRRRSCRRRRHSSRERRAA